MDRRATSAYLVAIMRSALLLFALATACAPVTTSPTPAPEPAGKRTPPPVEFEPVRVVLDSAPPVEIELEPPAPVALLPSRRIVAFYGNPRSTRMGILGQIAPDRMLSQLDREVAAWEQADPATPVQPALHLIVVVAAADPGWDGKYRNRMPSQVIDTVLAWAERSDAVLFLDIQPGLSTLRDELPRLEPWLKLPQVHLGIDPEFYMKRGNKPGTHIGTMDASDVNYAVEYLAKLVKEHGLPPKVLVIHRFTRGMLTNAARIELNPAVQVVIHMDGWGPPRLKRASYRNFVASEPVQFTGFKLFYRNDTRGGSRLMTPEEILELEPAPVYIQYH